MTRRDFLKLCSLAAIVGASAGLGVDTIDRALAHQAALERTETTWMARLIRRAHGRASRESCARAAQTLMRWGYVR